jgi:hypothetical protein
LLMPGYLVKLYASFQLLLQSCYSFMCDNITWGKDMTLQWTRSIASIYRVGNF